jgi:hypothetical protein
MCSSAAERTHTRFPSMLPDGRIAYLLRKPRRNGATHLVMMPM